MTSFDPNKQFQSQADINARFSGQPPELDESEGPSKTPEEAARDMQKAMLEKPDGTRSKISKRSNAKPNTPSPKAAGSPKTGKTKTSGGVKSAKGSNNLKGASGDDHSAKDVTNQVNAAAKEKAKDSGFDEGAWTPYAKLPNNPKALQDLTPKKYSDKSIGAENLDDNGKKTKRREVIDDLPLNLKVVIKDMGAKDPEEAEILEMVQLPEYEIGNDGNIHPTRITPEQYEKLGADGKVLYQRSLRLGIHYDGQYYLKMPERDSGGKAGVDTKKSEGEFSASSNIEGGGRWKKYVGGIVTVALIAAIIALPHIFGESPDYSKLYKALSPAP